MQKVLVTGGSGFIGAYLIDTLAKAGHYNILNIDIAKPADEEHVCYWKKVDILEKEAVLECFQLFQPTIVIHLAARTDTDPKTVLADYKANTDGTANVLQAIKACNSITRVIITSTQFVNQYNGVPKHDQDFAPHTVYGESKVICENLTRETQLDCCWTIIRPTNIWGPRHPRYPKEFWYILKKGKYVHPGRKPVIRSYGYVGNVTDQILSILKEEEYRVHQQVFYVGDGPIDLYDWVNGFSMALNQRKVTVVPRSFVKGLAIVGEVFQAINLKFPITLSRYKSMTHGNSAPMEKTFSVLGQPKYTLKDGIEETVSWLKSQDPFWRS